MQPNADPSRAEFWLIRHAPALDGGAMAGRRDVAADCSDFAAILALRARLAGAVAGAVYAKQWASPALRCQQTAAAIWPDAVLQLNVQLWEQDFGAWEGMAYADLPDIGTLGAEELAQFAPPHGESFAGVCARVWPTLADMGAGQHVIVAHAGVIRAALGLALGAAHLGIGFSVAPLSLTHISRDLASGAWAIHAVNWTAS